MARWDQADALLAEFGALIGLDGLAFDEEGHCLLAIEGGRVMEIEIASGDVVLSCVLGRPDAEREPGLLRKMLVLNSLWPQTGGLVMSLDASTGEIAQRRALPLAGLTASVLSEAIDAFIRQGEVLSGALARTSAPATDVASHEPDFEFLRV